MGLSFRLTVPNADGFRLRLRGIPPRLTDLTDVWPGAARPLTNMIIGQYNSQGARGPHGAWADLDPRYAERKRKKYGSKPIMQASGKSFAALIGPDAFHYEPRRMTYGVGAEFGYLLYQQTGFRTRLGMARRVARRLGFKSMFGETIGKAFVEARRIFDPVDNDRRSIQRGLVKSLTNKLRRAGYAAWSKAMETSEWPLQTLTPGQARLAGIAYYTS